MLEEEKEKNLKKSHMGLGEIGLFKQSQELPTLQEEICNEKEEIFTALCAQNSEQFLQ